MIVVERLLEFIRHRKRDYGHAFLSPAGQAVLADLATFCRATESCYNDDARRHAVAEGRREVWLRIQNHLHLTPEQLYIIHSGGKFIPNERQQPPSEDEGIINV
jgi:hypothetical protein